MKNLKLIAPASLIAVIFLASCHGLWNSNQLKLSGTVELTEHNVGARTAGRVTELFVDEGDTVKKGQVLATLDRYDQAKRDYVRTEQLFKQGGTTQQLLEEAQLTLEDQQAVSPVDGVVLIKVKEKGEVLTAGAPIVTVGDRSALWVKVYVPEGQVNRVHLNGQAILYFDGLKKKSKGHVSYISPRAEFTPRNVQSPEERVTQTFAVKVMLDQVEPDLRPGVASDVTINLKD